MLGLFQLVSGIVLSAVSSLRRALPTPIILPQLPPCSIGVVKLTDNAGSAA